MTIEQAFRLYDLRERREAILEELGEYERNNFTLRVGKRTVNRSSPVEHMAEDREDLMEELARIDAEIQEIEQGGQVNGL